MVKRLEPKDNVEILGVWMNAIGTDTKEYTRTTEGIDEWNEKMTAGIIFKKAARTGLRTTIYRTVLLPATSNSIHTASMYNHHHQTTS